jgi:hypothetical protein
MAISRAGNGLGPRTQVVSMPTADQATMDAQIQELGETHTIAGIDGTAGGTVIVALQGTADAPATLTGGTITVTGVADFDE